MSRSKIQMKLGGQARTLKFTLATFYRYDQDHKEGAAVLLIMRSPIGALLELSTYALTYPGNQNEIENDPTSGEVIEMVSDWIDELPKKELEKLAGLLLNSVKKYGEAWGDKTELTDKEKESIVKTVMSQ